MNGDDLKRIRLELGLSLQEMGLEWPAGDSRVNCGEGSFTLNVRLLHRRIQQGARKMSIYSRYEAQTERAWQDSQEAQAIGEIVTACAKAIFDAHEAETMEQLQRTIYKYTPCGPAVSFELHEASEDDSFEAQLGVCGPKPSCFVSVGDKRAETISQPWLSVRRIGVSSIVEGSDAEVPVTWIDLEQYANDDEYEGDLDGLAKIAVREFNNLVDHVNTEACALWDEANQE